MVQRSPTQKSGADIAVALDRIPPAAIFILMISEPLPSPIDQTPNEGSFFARK
jgi:hypothetical protein